MGSAKGFRPLTMLTVFLSLALFGTPSGVPLRVPSAFADEPQPATAKADAATVRVDANGNYIGVGIVVSANGHVLTSVQTAGSWRFAKYTVGDTRTPARVVALDDDHGLALLQATTPLNVTPVTLAAARAAKNSSVLLISYRQISSEPPMISRRKDNGTVANPSYMVDSSGTLDLRDLEIVRVRTQEQVTPNGYAPVIASKTGELEGFVIGFMRRYDVSDLLVMPASVIRTFLLAQKVPLP